MEEQKPQGPLELRPIPYREDAEDLLIMECPFCGKRGQYTKPQDAHLWFHSCGRHKERVAFLNGYAMRGIADYHRTNLPKGRS